jgi:hypothetical protein
MRDPLIPLVAWPQPLPRFDFAFNKSPRHPYQYLHPMK